MHHYTSNSQSASIGHGRYEYGPLIGSGGYADVYRGLDRSTVRDVAVKIRKPHAGDAVADQRADEAMELEYCVSVPHPGIASPIDGGDESGRRYVIYPFVEGKTLFDELLNGFVPRVDEVKRILAQLLDALRAVHQEGFAHGDLSLKNIMIDRDQQALTIIDFGSVCPLQGVGSGQRVAYHTTPGFMPPEMIGQSSVAWGPCQDLFGVGVCAYVLLTGTMPFMGDDSDQINQAVLTNNRLAVRDLCPNADSFLSDVTEKLLAPSSSRYQTADAVLNDLIPQVCNDAATPPQFNTQRETHARNRARCSACGAKTKPHVCGRCGMKLLPGLVLNLWDGVASMHSTYFIAEGMYPFGRTQIDPSDRTISRNQVVIQAHGNTVCMHDGGSCNPSIFQGIGQGNIAQPGTSLFSFSRYIGHLIHA